MARQGDEAMRNAEKIWTLVDSRKGAYEALSDRIWEMPELAYNEYRSAAEHRGMLEREGFRIEENLAGIPTAVMGEAGSGGPVIAILGEYDALPGLSRWPALPSSWSWRPEVTATAAATTSWARRRCSRLRR
jgi:metal-dependent amidase/aminoacylase/carboxypeptidase family protein